MFWFFVLFYSDKIHVVQSLCKHKTLKKFLVCSGLPQAAPRESFGGYVFPPFMSGEGCLVKNLRGTAVYLFFAGLSSPSRKPWVRGQMLSVDNEISNHFH